MKKYSLSLLLSVWFYVATAQRPVQQVPQFVFYTLNKKTFTKQDMLPHKKAFFMFFDSDCDHCQHAAHEINLQYKRFNRIGIYLVTLDGPEKIANFMTTYCPNLMGKTNVTILRDLRNEFITDFNPRRYPSMLLFSVKGKLLIYQDDPNALNRIFKFL